MQKSMETVWKKIKSAIRGQIPQHSFQMWIEPLELEKGDNDDWILLCPNFFSKKRVHDLYGELIVAELNRQNGGACNLSFAISGKSKQSLESKKRHNNQLPYKNRFLQQH